MNDSRYQHPAKQQLRVILTRLAPRLGLTAGSVEELVHRAHVEVSSGIICTSDDRDDVVRIVVHGAVRIEIVCSARRRMIFKLHGTGELFCLPPDAPHAAYHLEAHAHDHATVATWTRDSLTAVIGMLPPSGVVRLLTTGWLHLSRAAEGRCLLRMLRAEDRVWLFLQRLARRHGVACPDGVLIDLRLLDRDLGLLVGATRSTVNRRLRRLGAAGLIQQIDDRIILLQREQRTTA
jgi:CRP-like cAMP-binding protein